VFDEPGRCLSPSCASPSPSRYEIDSGLSPLESSLNFTVNLGILAKFDSFSFGLSYASRPLGGSESGVEIDAPHSRIVPGAPGVANADGTTPTAMAPPLCPPGAGESCLFARLRYGLPDVFSAGATWLASRVFQIDLIGRYARWSAHEAAYVSVVAAPGSLAARGLPDQVALGRDFHDSADLRLRLIAKFQDSVRLSLGARIEMPAVSKRTINPAAIDGFKGEPSAAIEVRVSPKVRLRAGYAFSWMLPVNNQAGSRFDGSATDACARSGNSLEEPSCREKAQGFARPAVLGRYERYVHAASFGVLVDM
jgi:hypothetical protein